MPDQTTVLVGLTLEEAKANAIDFLSESNVIEVRPTGDHLYAAKITPLGAAPPPGPGPGPGPGPQPPPTERGLPTGEAILEIAKRHVGQQYGHKPPSYTDPFWKGSFDCAEFASYCAFRAYRILFGTRPKGNIASADAYTGYWREDVQTAPGVAIPWQEALRTPGAFLLRFPPGTGRMGHIAICVGDGDHIFEAHSTRLGVIRGSAAKRRWDVGVKLPGVSYKGGAVVSEAPAPKGKILVFRLLDPLAGFDETVQQLQEALQAKGFLTAHDVNGIYDERMCEAVERFQKAEGLLADGEVGPDTGKALLGEANWKKVEDQDQDQADAGPPSAMGRDLLIMARTIFGEARGEPNEGREAVGNVIVNRSRSGRYPSNIADVCQQPFQFSCWNKNDPNRAKIVGLMPGADKTFDECLAVAERVLRGAIPDRTSGALHYYSKKIKEPKWVGASPKARMTAEIGVHRFFVGIR